MAHFAKIEDGVVTSVTVIDNKDILDESDTESEEIGIQLCVGFFGGTWLQTSYNGSFRKNYAGIGDKYDTVRDAFIAPSNYPSWVLNESTCQWETTVPIPDGTTENDFVEWNEDTLSWIVTKYEAV